MDALPAGSSRSGVTLVRISTLREGEVTPLVHVGAAVIAAQALANDQEEALPQDGQPLVRVLRVELSLGHLGPARQRAQRKAGTLRYAHVVVAAQGGEMAPLLEIDALGAGLPVPVGIEERAEGRQVEPFRLGGLREIVALASPHAFASSRRSASRGSRDPARRGSCETAGKFALLSRSGDPAAGIATKGSRPPARGRRAGYARAPSVPATWRIVPVLPARGADRCQVEPI